MARNTKLVTIPGTRSETPGSRDNGKTFKITEMAAKPAEKWADRAFLALAASELNIPRGMAAGGMAGIRQFMQLVGHLRFPDLEPLMDELMACVQFVPEPRKPEFTRALVDSGTESDDIEEVGTRHFLRSEVLALHINFLLAATILNSIATASTMTVQSFEAIPTSRKRSGRLSRAA